MRRPDTRLLANSIPDEAVEIVTNQRVAAGTQKKQHAARDVQSTHTPLAHAGH